MYCSWPEWGRCCFCLPLRRGLLVIGYFSILYSAFMIGVNSYSIHNDTRNLLPYYHTHVLNYGGIPDLPEEICLTLYCAQLVFEALLIYGVHAKSVVHLKAYFYFSLVTTAAVVVLQVIGLFVNQYHMDMLSETLIFTFVGLCVQLYLISMVRSFLKKIDVSGPHVYDNQLHNIQTDESIIETNGIISLTTSPT